MPPKAAALAPKGQTNLFSFFNKPKTSPAPVASVAPVETSASQSTADKKSDVESTPAPFVTTPLKLKMVLLVLCPQLPN